MGQRKRNAHSITLSTQTENFLNEYKQNQYLMSFSAAIEKIVHEFSASLSKKKEKKNDE